MFFDGAKLFIWNTLVAVCNPAVDIQTVTHASAWSASEVRAPGRRRQRVFQINNFAPSKHGAYYRERKGFIYPRLNDAPKQGSNSTSMVILFINWTVTYKCMSYAYA